MAKKNQARRKKMSGSGSLSAQTGTGTGQRVPDKQQPLQPAARSAKKNGVVAAISAGAIILIAVLFFLFMPFGRSPVKRDGRMNVLLITMDTTRADRLGCYGYTKGRTPNLDSLARKGVLFENVYCQVPLTLPSHCSIMTGTYPFAHRVHNNGTYALGPEHETIAKILKARGFKTGAIVASFSVDSRFGLGQGFEIYDDDIQPGQPFKTENSERRAERVFALFSVWLESHSKEQFFAWVHFFDPHSPYQPPSPYKEEFAANPYDGEIAYMDASIGAIVDKLKEKNILGQTLVVLAGDHGEAFGEKVETGHGVFLYDETMKVPLLFYSENRLPAGKVVRSRVRLVDIAPSILDLLNLPKMSQAQGTSLVPYIEGREKNDRETYIETFYPKENYGWSELIGFIRDDWKYIRAPKPELYNLKTDPNENTNVYSATPKIASDLNRGLETLIKKSAGIAGTTNRALTVEEEERLRSLGYTSFSGGGTKSGSPDPKDHLDILRLTQQAGTYEFDKNYLQAETVYEELLSLLPDSPASFVNLALVQIHMQKFDAAIQTLLRGEEKIPHSEALLSRLGYAYLAAGRYEEAFGAMAQVLQINPRHVDALTMSAGILDILGKKKEARDFYERGLAIEPKSKYLRLNYAQNLASGGMIAQAIDTYKGLVNDYPDDHVLYQDLGAAYGSAGRFEEAIEVLQRSVAIRPTPVAFFNLAVAFKQKGEITEAVRYLKLYLQDTKGETEAVIQTARTELNKLERSIKK